MIINRPAAFRSQVGFLNAVIQGSVLPTLIEQKLPNRGAFDYTLTFLRSSRRTARCRIISTSASMATRQLPMTP